MSTWLQTLMWVTAILVIAQPSVRADEILIGAMKDNTLYEHVDGKLTNGGGSHFFSGRVDERGGGLIRRGLLAFDIAGRISPGSTITRVELTLNMSRTISGPVTTRLHRVLADWGEGTVVAPGQEGGGGPSAEGDATWIHTAFDDQFWDDVGGDFDPDFSASRSVAGLGFYTWASTPELVSDVQGWLDDPDKSFGWMVIGDEKTLGSAKRFDTRENQTEENRPVLRVEFTPAVCTGKERLSLKCAGKRQNRGRIIAKLKKGRDGSDLTFRLDQDPDSDRVKRVKNGKAKTKYKKVPGGDHTVEVIECELERETSCP